MRVMTLVSLVFHVGGRNGDAALAFFGSIVNAVERTKLTKSALRHYFRDRCRQCRLAVVDMTDRPYVHMGLLPLKFFLCHCDCPPLMPLTFNFFDYFVSNYFWNLLVVTKNHRIGRSSLGKTPKIRRIAKHFGKRYLGIDHLATTTTLHSQDLSSPGWVKSPMTSPM